MRTEIVYSDMYDAIIVRWIKEIDGKEYEYSFAFEDNLNKKTFLHHQEMAIKAFSKQVEKV